MHEKELAFAHYLVYLFNELTISALHLAEDEPCDEESYETSHTKSSRNDCHHRVVMRLGAPNVETLNHLNYKPHEPDGAEDRSSDEPPGALPFHLHQALARLHQVATQEQPLRAPPGRHSGAAP